MTYTVRRWVPVGTDHARATVVDEHGRVLHVLMPYGLTGHDRAHAVIEHAITVAPTKPPPPP